MVLLICGTKYSELAAASSRISGDAEAGSSQGVTFEETGVAMLEGRERALADATRAVAGPKMRLREL